MCTVRISIYSANIKNVMKIWFHGKKKNINKKLDKEAKWEDRYKFARIPEKIIKYHWCINKIIKIMSWHCWIALLWLNKTNSVVGRLMFCNGEKKGEWQLSMMSFDTMPPQTVQRPEKKNIYKWLFCASFLVFVLRCSFLVLSPSNCACVGSGCRQKQGDSLCYARPRGTILACDMSTKNHSHSQCSVHVSILTFVYMRNC